MVVQAIVDHDYLFRDICVGWPGSVHDARVFVNSLIFKKITDDNILAGMDRILCGSCVPVCIVGDCVSIANLADEAIHQFSSFCSAEVFQLSPLTSSHCCGKCIWMFKGTMEAAAQEE